MTDLSIIITTFNRSKIIFDNIKKLEPLLDDCEIIVIDDASSDDTFTSLSGFSKKYHNFKLIKNETNMGIMASWNRALNESTRNNVFILNDDVSFFYPSQLVFVKRLLALLEHADLVGVKLIESVENTSNERLWHNMQNNHSILGSIFSTFLYFLSGQIFSTTSNHRGFVPYVTSMMAFRRKLGVKLLFDELNYGDVAFKGESDFQLRARQSNLSIYYDSTLKLLHSNEVVGGIYSQSVSSFNIHFWKLRNHVVFLRKNLPRGWFFRTVIYIIYNIILNPTKIKSTFAAIKSGILVKINVKPN